MKIKDLTGLSIVECKYCDAYWYVETGENEPKMISSIREFEQPRDVDLYHLCGVYHKAKVPFEVHEVNYENYKQYEPHVGLPLNFSDEVYAGIKKGNAVLVAGGYCVYAPAVVGGIQRAIGEDKKIGIIWIDAHADNQIPETTQKSSVTMVGIPLSTIVGQTSDEWRKEACGLVKPCSGKNVIASDLRISDEESDSNLKAAQIVHIDSASFEDESIWKKSVDELAKKVDVIYISIDVDILKSEFIPAYEKVVPGGHDINVVMNNVRLVMETNKVIAFSVFCVDFDHYENNGEYTYLSGMKIIGAALEKWGKMPCLD
ncbi:arginase family protein [Fusibacter ferrireducens]|uniref:Arginase family protein n=1 Tax=Fusibacter ferrireducens TaxID=2785058 RepID=A0ABR9ZPY8_9FIRM|nr:arginase family protein [Fusibacter ferrireducens]MBF4692193.1 arginase family protein [Fusibacter ferrireducens]